ncbi:MAG: threonine dehydratase [Candidatus Paceibacteria bacterium]|jgi:threonine dehydratase
MGARRWGEVKGNCTPGRIATPDLHGAVGPSVRLAFMFDTIDIEAAAGRIQGVVRTTPLLPLTFADPRFDLRGKMENRQETGSFKCRGAWNQISQLTEGERARGVIATSSGNHGRALAWAARRAGVKATIVMPADAYPNKIEACRELGAEVVLGADRQEAEALCRERMEQGALLIHPYDSERTVAGAGTVGREIALEWPEVEVVLVPVGGGGLISGSSLALRRALGSDLQIFGVEPKGAPSMSLGLEAGHPVPVPAITTDVQGLCPLASGELNVNICKETLNGVFLMEDGPIFAAQKRLVEFGEIVEPAGAATTSAVLGGALPDALLWGRTAQNPLRVVVVVSGGNPAPDQLAALTRKRSE